MDESKRVTIIEELKGGGQKEVFRASHPELGEVVFKKIYPKDDSIERTKREVLAVSLLNSAHIPKIYFHNCEQESPNPLWLIEEYVSGQNLRSIIQGGNKFDITQICDFLEIMLDLTILSEEINLVHRDIKPDNIMLDDHNKIWLLDFGIARHLDLESITDTNSPFGVFTLGYASSEQFRNLKKEIDIRSDLFSIGVVAYELLLGENFYIKDSNNDVFQIIKKLENNSIPAIRINGDAQFQLSAFIRLLGDHRRYRRPRTAILAKEIYLSLKPTLNL